MSYLHERPGGSTPLDRRPLAVFLFVWILVLLLAVVACDMESYNQTKAVEDATKEVERTFDDKRKEVDDLPNCNDARDVVYTVEWKRGKDAGNRYLSKIENYHTLNVEVTERTATITCTGEAWRKDGRYVGEIVYWVRKNKRDEKGTHYAGYDVGSPQSQSSSKAEETTPTLTPTATSGLPPTRVPGAPCPTASEQAYFTGVNGWLIGLGLQLQKIGRLSDAAGERPSIIRSDSWKTDVGFVLTSFRAIADELSRPNSLESVQSVRGDALRLADAIRAFAEAYNFGMENQDPAHFDEATRRLNTIGPLVKPLVNGIDNFCQSLVGATPVPAAAAASAATVAPRRVSATPTPAAVPATAVPRPTPTPTATPEPSPTATHSIATPTSQATRMPTLTPTPEPTPTPATTNTPVATATPTPTPEPDLGTFSFPYPAGSTMQGSDGTVIVVTGINGDAWPVVRRENQFNDPPQPGNRFYIVTVEVSNVSAHGPLNVGQFDFELIGDNRVIYKTYQHTCGVIPDELWGEVYPGGKTRGNTCFEVGANEGGFLLIHNPGFSRERRFLSIE